MASNQTVTVEEIRKAIEPAGKWTATEWATKQFEKLDGQVYADVAELILIARRDTKAATKRFYELEKAREWKRWVSIAIRDIVKGHLVPQS